MVADLLNEIMRNTGIQSFAFDAAATTNRLTEFLREEKYRVLVSRSEYGGDVGFVSMYESYALYAEGVFGTLAELYVRPAYRSQGIGHQLVEGAKAYGADRGWTRLEVTTPPLPQFERTLRFYEREGFAVTGGRKLKVAL